MKKVKQSKPQHRKTKAFEYYMAGLNSKEIAKILNCSFRTIQNYMHKDQWKKKRKILRFKSD
jgi:uncharacterized protein YjcR